MFTMEYYSAVKNNESLPFATTWMEKEGITLSAVRQRKTPTLGFQFYEEYKTSRPQNRDNGLLVSYAGYRVGGRNTCVGEIREGNKKVELTSSLKMQYHFLL